ncbi:MAG TPA: hypothetical protein VJ717_20735 [Gemmatimonadaceae bacterium]|nr:hypothetical protein [Gemmatimonadaceae bacterium]
MIRLSLASIALCGIFAFVPLSAAGAQNIEQPAVAAQQAQNDALSVKQVGLNRATLREHTRHGDVVLAGTTTSLTQTRTRRGQTLMIVGGAAFLAGLIIGDDAGTAIAVGGAAIGLYGLYLWAQ